MTHKTEIFVHCLATKPDWMIGASAEEKMKEVRRWHVEERGWKAEGYACLIAYNGDKAYGRDLDGDGDFYEETAAAARGYNKSAVHIALEGGFGSNADDLFSDHYTPEQDHELRREIERIKHWAAQSGGKIKAVRGHNEVANKACPGFNVQRWYAGKTPPMKFNLPEINGPALMTAGSALGSVTTTFGGLDTTSKIILGTVAVSAILAGAYVLAPVIRRKLK